MKEQISDLPLLTDQLNRQINYLRLSITDRCNLKCIYCQPQLTRTYIPHSDIMRYEHMLRFLRTAHALGINKVRITGGEPFTRKDCIKFLMTLRAAFPSLHLAVTTNGTLLEPYIEDLGRLNLASLNLSLDTLDSSAYARLTGENCLSPVLDNLNRLLKQGIRVKINAVLLKGITEAAIKDFIYMAKTLPIDIRFIEYMPMGKGTLWNEHNFLPADHIYAQLQQHTELSPAAKDAFSGPAKLYNILGAKGRIGFITALSNHFCNSCNRIRLTSEGNLRLCLFADKEYKLGRLIKNDAISDRAIGRALKNACQHRFLGYKLLQKQELSGLTNSRMVSIGG